MKIEWKFWLPGKDRLKITVNGYVIPEGAVFVKCQLCKGAIPQDDFPEHGRWHTTLQHTSVEAVEGLLK